MSLSVSLAEGRVACVESVEAFVTAAVGFSEFDLLGAARCHGWTRLDVVVHVLAGWQEMFLSLADVGDEAPTLDAATFWPAFAADPSDPVDTIMFQRRRTAIYARPADAIRDLRRSASAIVAAVMTCRDGSVRLGGDTMTTGDFLATWAVEHAIHHLDLQGDTPAAARALRLARSTVEALLGTPLPADWPDDLAALVGSGRVSAPPGVGDLADRLPVIG